MKTETAMAKMFEAIGLKDVADKIKAENDPKAKKKEQSNLNKYIGVSESEISNFRAAQGLIYFLQAPELFSAKVCPHCGESFLVSRQFVAFCSYTCIEKDLEKKGIKWSRTGNIESLVNDIYEGNEPLWITGEMRDRLLTILNEPKKSLLNQNSDQQNTPSDSVNTPSLV